MKRNRSHLSDRELTMALDRELPARDANRVEEHLAACWSCRSRKLELERAITGFVHVYRSQEPTTADGPRATLKARLAQLAQTNPRVVPWRPVLLASAAAAVVFAVVVSLLPSGVSARTVVVPNPSLTPGAAVLMNRAQLCKDTEPNNKDVPVSLKRRVLAEYGLSPAETRAYEVDYLITPALGGADDIHNLWPHSYTNTEWNAKVKDALENQLRNMVCEGQLDLATAQRELATNWIDAYKKYFHTDRPVVISQ
jgi:hypothetical protein